MNDKLPNWIEVFLTAEEKKKQQQQELLQKLLSANIPKAASNIKDSYNRITKTINQSISGEITKGRELPDQDSIGIADGRILQAAILYNDLRGFSKMISTFPKRKSLLVLDSFVSEMARIAFDFNGTVVDCAGDRILAVFWRPYGDTSVKPVHEAIICAFWMQTVIAKVLNPVLNRNGLPIISSGIGIDYGAVTVARVGIRNRNKLVFLGDAANWAARLEGIAAEGETILSVTAYNKRPGFMNTNKGWIFSPKPNLLNPSWYSCNSIFVNDTAPSL